MASSWTLHQQVALVIDDDYLRDQFDHVTDVYFTG